MIYQFESFETSKLWKRTYLDETLKQYTKNRILKVTNSLLELGKYFKEFKDRELRKEIFFKRFNMGKFEEERRWRDETVCKQLSIRLVN